MDKASGILIVGGQVIDGTGSEPFRADVRVRDGRIVELAGNLSCLGERIVRAEGLTLCPGFIDSHTHDDRILLQEPAMTPKITQGVTTVITGNCGISLMPLVTEDAPSPLTLLGGGGGFVYDTLARYAAAFRQAAPSVNAACLIGHSTLRVAAMDDVSRLATEQEQEQMAALLSRAMEDGAAGLSSGLFYKTAAAADAAEVGRLAAIVGGYGGVLTTHIRSEFDDILEAMEESYEISERGGLPLVLSHHKCAGPANWGRTTETLARIDTMRARRPAGREVGLDVYPYVAGSTVLDVDMVDGIIDIMLTWSTPHPEMRGRMLKEIAADWGCAEREACRRLMPGGACYFQMRQDDMERVLAYPHTMIGSDGLPHDAHPHPRLWGTFPRVLGHFCRERKLFPLPEAIRRMTSLTAARFRLKDRGVIREGTWADIVVFDPETIADRASFENPRQPSVGIDTVMVNGHIAVASALETGERGGRFLKMTDGACSPA